MDKGIKSLISLESYRVEKIDFKINEHYTESDEPVEINIDFVGEISVNKNHNKAIVKIECIVFENYSSLNKPFYLNVVISGLFSYESDLDEKNLNDMLSTNAVAILFPYLRATISILTVNTGVLPLVLPTVNISKLLRHKKDIE